MKLFVAILGSLLLLAVAQVVKTHATRAGFDPSEFSGHLNRSVYYRRLAPSSGVKPWAVLTSRGLAFQRPNDFSPNCCENRARLA